MKKIFFCLSIFIFLGLLLFSCTPTEDNPTTPVTPDVPTAPVDPTPDDPTVPVDPTPDVPTEPTPVVPKTFYTTSSGNFSENEGTLTSNEAYSIAYRSDGTTFTEGTLSCDINLNGNTQDNGIIFGLINENNLTNFWEDEGIHYYFFFISNIGTAYLGKVSNKTWTVCGEVPIPNLDRNKTYKLEVSRQMITSGVSILCYLDGQLQVSYKDYKYYDGTGFGVRAATPDVTYSNITISSEIKGEATSLDDYVIASGSFTSSEGMITSTTGNAIAEKKGQEFVYGTLEATMTSNGGYADNGIIFNLTPNETHSYWESDVAYYFFFINLNGGAYLGKVDYGTWKACEYLPVNNYNPNNTYRLKVVKDDSTISCYINDELYFTHADEFPLEGTGYGLRAGGKNVSYTNVKCESSGTIIETYPDDVTTLNGTLVGSNGAVKSKGVETLALLNNKTLNEGTYQAKIKGVSTKRSGLIFNYQNDGTTESYYRFVTRKDAQKVEIDKVVNGNVTNLYSNYLSAGYQTGAEYQFKVVIKEGKAHCYFWNTLYYVFEIEQINGQVGLYAEGPSSQFRNYEVTTNKETIEVDTLLFGHSYFELWYNFKSDFASLATEHNLGTYTNIGIGGSVASHWEKFKESLVTYQADTVIYWIGINDLSGGTSPASIIGSIKETLSYMKEYNPDLKVILLSCNHCPARTNIKSTISELNELMKTYCAQYNWISYAEMEYAFADNGITPDAYWFTDGLHPSANGYTQKVIPAIKNALLGNDQPTIDEELNDKLLEESKQLKLIQLYDYDEHAYTTEKWQEAKPIYDEAVQKINNAKTIDELNNLDLSSYINNLENISSKTDYLFNELVSGSNNSVWETQNFTNALNSSQNNVFNVYHDGHRIVNDSYGDMSFNVCLGQIQNEFPTLSIIFRATQTSALGLNGYLLNFVTEPNYLQVWYMRDAYGTSASNELTYLGGWVFPEEVEDTTFKVIIEGNNIYIYTLESFLKNGIDAYGCSVDLSVGGTKTVYNTGGFGILCWSGSTNAQGKLTISNFRAITTSTNQKSIISNKVEYIPYKKNSFLK